MFLAILNDVKLHILENFSGSHAHHMYQIVECNAIPRILTQLSVYHDSIMTSSNHAGFDRCITFLVSVMRLLTACIAIPRMILRSHPFTHFLAWNYMEKL